MFKERIIAILLIPATIGFLASCGKESEAVSTAPIAFEQGAKQIGCTDSNEFGGGKIWDGTVYFKINKISGPRIEKIDEKANNFEVSNYNFKFDLLGKNGNVVASSSVIELIGKGSVDDASLGVTFSPVEGYEATQYVAYLDGKQIASEDVGVWVEYPGEPTNIANGKCERNWDVDWEEFIYNLPWCKTAFKPQFCPK